MKFSKNNIMKSFETCDQRTQDFLEYIIDELKSKDKVFNNYTLVILQLLAVQLDIFFKAQDEVDHNVIESNETKYGNVRKIKPEVTVLMNSHKEITRLLDKLGLSPLEKAKIKKLNSNEENVATDGTNILTALVG